MQVGGKRSWRLCMAQTTYWDKAAKDPEVDIKYISDVDTDICLKDLGILKGEVLEIGCGVGRLLKDGDYGVDISANMLEIAFKRKPKCHFSLITDGSIPHVSSFFDTVFTYLVFQHLKPDEVQNYMNEAYRVLKKGGVFKFQFIQGTEREPLSNHYTIGEITQMLAIAGFGKATFKKSKAHFLWTIAEVTK